MVFRVNRCVLFVPVNNPRFVEKAWTRGADAIILDLEDSVPPSEKSRARSLVRDTIPKVARGGAAVFVRINKEFAEADLRGAIWPGISRVIFPKAESADEVAFADSLITELEKERGIPLGTVEIYPLLESALGVVNSYSIATSSPRVKVMADAGGGYDTALDLEIEMFAGFDQYSYLRERPSLAQMAAGVETVGTPFIPGASGRVNQPDEGVRLARALRAWDVHEAVILHPALVAPLVTGLTPKPGEVRWARKVVATYETLEQEGESVIEIDDKVVDIYEYRRARELLLWAEACATKYRRKARAMDKNQPRTE